MKLSSCLRTRPFSPCVWIQLELQWSLKIKCGLWCPPCSRAPQETLGKVFSLIPSHHWGQREWHSPNFQVIIRSSHIFLKDWSRVQVPPQQLCCSAPMQNTETVWKFLKVMKEAFWIKNLQSKLKKNTLDKGIWHNFKIYIKILFFKEETNNKTLKNTRGVKALQ